MHKLIRVPDGTLRILVQGIERIKLERAVEDDPYLVGEFSPLPDEVAESREVEALTRNVQNLFARVIGLVPYLPEELQLAAANVEDPSALAHLVASTLRLKTEEKQRLLELVDVEERLRAVSAILNRELEVLELGTKIQSQVQSEMEKGQREFFLRQQLKAIQEELGEGDAEQAEVNELRERLESLELPEEVRKAAERELARLERLPAAAAEYGVIRTYLEWILTLPWNTVTEDNLDLDQARKILDEDHYDLEKVKDRIIEYLAVSKLKQEVSGPILCFVGPPGVGKTSLGQSIARTLGRKFTRISVGGVRDEAEIRGHRRTYIGAMPGTIIRSLRDAESMNPVLLIDEIDKMGADFRGDPASAMLEVLDPEQNRHFRDHYLDVPFDLSKVLFICTANTLDTIPGPLLDRMDVIQLSGYTEEEKLGIAKRYLVPKQLEAHGLTKSRVAIPDAVLRTVIREYTREAGVRNLERRIADLDRKAATLIAEGRGREDPRRRAAAPRVARPAPLQRRRAQAGFRAGRRDRPRVHGRRRRRPLHRGGGLPRQGAPDHHRPARRGDAGVGAGGAVVGARARRATRAAGGLVREARRAPARSRRRRAEGRPLRRRDDGDRDRVARPRRARLAGCRHDRRDHAHRAGPARSAASARRCSRRSAPGSSESSCRARTSPISKSFRPRRARRSSSCSSTPSRRCSRRRSTAGAPTAGAAPPRRSGRRPAPSERCKDRRRWADEGVQQRKGHAP